MLHWCYDFKKKHHIGSRKILKKFSRKQARDLDSVRTSAYNFVNSIKPYFDSHGARKIFNTDQTGIGVIQCSDRTLEINGTKFVIGQFTQIHSLTHSYTVQPTVSADGTLLTPVFVALQEPGCYSIRRRNGETDSI